MLEVPIRNLARGGQLAIVDGGVLIEALPGHRTAVVRIELGVEGGLGNVVVVGVEEMREEEQILVRLD